MSSVTISGDTSGSIILQAPSVSGSTTLTLPTTSGTVLTNASSVTSSQLPAGSILQVAQTVKTDTFSTAPGAVWTDITGLSVAITPSSASNRIMIFFSVHGNTTNLSYVRLVRDSTAIGVGETSGSRVSCTVGNFSETGDGNRSFEWGTNFLDSPATTSSITYKLQVLCETSNTFFLNRSRNDQNNTVGFRPISQITVMEVRG